MFWCNKTVVEFDLVQHQISVAWSSDVRLSFVSPNITCHGKTNLVLDSVSSNNCLLSVVITGVTSSGKLPSQKFSFMLKYLCSKS